MRQVSLDKLKPLNRRPIRLEPNLTEMTSRIPQILSTKNLKPVQSRLLPVFRYDDRDRTKTHQSPKNESTEYSLNQMNHLVTSIEKTDHDSVSFMSVQ